MLLVAWRVSSRAGARPQTLLALNVTPFHLKYKLTTMVYKKHLGRDGSLALPSLSPGLEVTSSIPIESKLFPYTKTTNEWVPCGNP